MLLDPPVPVSADSILLGRQDHRSLPYGLRHGLLTNRLVTQDNALVVAPAYTTARQKRLMFQAFANAQREGVIFRRVNGSPYQVGRAGDSLLKHKFVATASCIVAGANGGKRSVALELLDGSGQRVAVGSVTVPVNRAVPTPGTVVEVRYLYAFRGGSLFQPVYLGEREDIDVGDCGVGQLKYKPEE